VEMELCLTDQKPATMVYKSDFSFTSTEDAFKQMYPEASDEILQNLIEAAGTSAKITDLIEKHGHVVSGNRTLVNPGATLEKCQLSIVKGGLLYAEPANDHRSDGARIMLLGSATRRVYYARSL